MFITNPKGKPLCQLRVKGVIPFPLVIHAGCTEEIEDKSTQALIPYVQQFGLKATKNKPKNCVMEADYESPEETLNEPAPKKEETDPPLNEPAPKKEETDPSLNEPKDEKEPEVKPRATSKKRGRKKKADK